MITVNFYGGQCINQPELFLPDQWNRWPKHNAQSVHVYLVSLQAGGIIIANSNNYYIALEYFAPVIKPAFTIWKWIIVDLLALTDWGTAGEQQTMMTLACPHFQEQTI